MSSSKLKYKTTISFSSDFGHHTIHGRCQVGYDTIEISYSYNHMTFSELGEKMKEISEELDRKAEQISKLKKLK